MKFDLPAVLFLFVCNFFCLAFLPFFWHQNIYFCSRGRLLSAGRLETSRDTEKNRDSSPSLSDPIPLLAANEKVCFVVLSASPPNGFHCKRTSDWLNKCCCFRCFWVVFFSKSLIVLQHWVIGSVFKTTLRVIYYCRRR